MRYYHNACGVYVDRGMGAWQPLGIIAFAALKPLTLAASKGITKGFAKTSSKVTEL